MDSLKERYIFRRDLGSSLTSSMVCKKQAFHHDDSCVAATVQIKIACKKIWPTSSRICTSSFLFSALRSLLKIWPAMGTASSSLTWTVAMSSFARYTPFNRLWPSTRKQAWSWKRHFLSCQPKWRITQKTVVTSYCKFYQNPHEQWKRIRASQISSSFAIGMKPREHEIDIERSMQQSKEVQESNNSSIYRS